MNTAIKKQIIQKWTNEQPSNQKIITLFEKVRDIPYGDIGSRDPVDVYRQNKGTCSGKHELLRELYQQLGIQVKDYLVMHRFKEMPVKFPNHIQNILNRSDILDPHNFFKILVDKNCVIVDATWNKPLKKLGFPVNENWDGKTDMQIAVVPEGKIFETDDPVSLKKQLIGQLPDQVQKDRKLFLAELTEWLNLLKENKQLNL